MKNKIPLWSRVLLALLLVSSLISTVQVHAQGVKPTSEVVTSGINTICDDDDRVQSFDPRIGRLVFASGTNPANDEAFCTAWLVGNGAVLTAGHCVDFDPDKGGPGLPDGISNWIGKRVVVQFNVPDSKTDGEIRRPAPEDIYQVDIGTEEFEFFGSGVSDGRDWAVFALNENPITHQTAHQRQGFLRITNRNPESDAAIRITGFGVDEGFTNQIQQTHLGDLDGENNSNGHLWYDYNVDTMGANSGSPILWEARNMAIGIHNSGGCDEILGIFGSNKGTSFDTPNLGPTINNFNGPNTIHVDTVLHPGTPNGWIFNPYNSLFTANANVPENGQISIAAGVYNGNVIFNRPATIIAPSGTVVIVGQSQ